MPISRKFYLSKRSNGYWYIGYFDDGKLRWKSSQLKIKSDALSILNDFENNLLVRTNSILFSDFEKHFVLMQANILRESTLKEIYQRSFKVFKTIVGDRMLLSYTLKDVEQFKLKRIETCSPTTVNIEFRALRAAFNLAIKWQLLNENPFQKSGQIKLPERVPIYLQKDDLQKLLEKVKESELKEVYIFAVLTGLRLGEILNLQWSNIDFQRNLIVLDNATKFTTKSGKCRNVPMNNLVIEILRKRSLFRQICNWVFNRRGLPLTESFVSHKFKKYVEEAKLNDAFHFHSLRHTFATWLVQDGVNIYEVQKLLGHSSVKVTEIYSHLAASELHN